MSIRNAIMRTLERRSKELYKRAEEKSMECMSSVDAPTRPWIFNYVVDEDADDLLSADIKLTGNSAISDKWLYKIMETFNLNKYGRGYLGYHKGDVWVMIDIFYEDKHYMYIYNDRNACIGTCLITRDKDKKQHYDWNKPWFPGQRSSSYYDDSHWD